MRTYTWEEYYEKFYDWAESTQSRNLSQLTTLGDVDEVAEIIIELQVNVSAANRLLKRADEMKMKFKADDLIEFLNICDMKLAEEAVSNSVSRLCEADMEDLYGYISDELIVDICRQRKFQLPEDMREEEEYEEGADYEEDDEEIEEKESEDDFYEDPVEEYIAPQRKQRGGFLATLFAGLAGAAEGISDVSNHHNGKCNGDCANCPPHYGYRYGRWYYGHDHMHGCEFGGNKGGGGSI
ncbi:MAG: hypothetical protein PHX08_02390 [Lachnospiraceae bacterium]|nr:hypothetical protein [Lachnospiraceae bacterium]